MKNNNGINWKRMYEELRELNVKFMCKKISMDDFICSLYELDESIEKQLKGKDIRSEKIR